VNPDTIFDAATDAFPSGDGTAGGAFTFRLTTMWT